MTNIPNWTVNFPYLKSLSHLLIRSPWTVFLTRTCSWFWCLSLLMNQKLLLAGVWWCVSFPQSLCLVHWFRTFRFSLNLSQKKSVLWVKTSFPKNLYSWNSLVWLLWRFNRPISKENRVMKVCKTTEWHYWKSQSTFFRDQLFAWWTFWSWHW